MAHGIDVGYLSTIPGILNIVEIFVVLGALISVSFTSPLYAELVDNQRWIYPELCTAIVRPIFQTFCVICIAITIAIIVVHVGGARFSLMRFPYLNRTCSLLNLLMAIMMISVGICAAFWEDKLRRTPLIVQRGYYRNEPQYLYGELTQAMPGAAAAAAAFALLAGILYLIEAFTRPTLGTRVIGTGERTYVNTSSPPIQYYPGGASGTFPGTSYERVIPVETTITNKYRA